MPANFAAGKTPRILVGLFGAGLIVWLLYPDPPKVVVNEKPQPPPELHPAAAPALPVKTLSEVMQPSKPSLAQRASIVLSTCTAPADPGEDPDGKRASRGELLTAKTAIVEYNANLDRYIACLEDKSQRLKDEYSGIATDPELDELEAHATRLRNSAVDQVVARVEKFNQQLRAYKAAHPK